MYKITKVCGDDLAIFPDWIYQKICQTVLETIADDDCKNAKMCIAKFWTPLQLAWSLVEQSEACHITAKPLTDISKGKKNVMSFLLTFTWLLQF